MPDVRPFKWRLKVRLKRSADVVIGPLAVDLLKLVPGAMAMAVPPVAVTRVVTLTVRS